MNTEAATTSTTVTVVVTVSNLTDPPTVTCTPPTAVVTEPNSLVVFDLVTAGYAFPTSNSVTVTDGGTEFPNLWYIDPVQVALQDQCSSTAEYEYTVVVDELSTGKQYRHDPKISNEPS
jgi:hypothetical protein